MHNQLINQFNQNRLVLRVKISKKHRTHILKSKLNPV